jgi:hypothetical protein
VDRVDRAELGRSEDADHREDGAARLGRRDEAFLEVHWIEAHRVVDVHLDELRGAEAEHLHRLLPGVVRARRHEHARVAARGRRGG